MKEMEAVKEIENRVSILKAIEAAVNWRLRKATVLLKEQENE